MSEARKAVQTLEELAKVMCTQNAREVWDILTALRGPDANPLLAEPLKGIFTYRIRFFVFRSEDIPAYVRTTPRINAEDLALAVEKLYNRKEKAEGLRHFLGHAIGALNALISLDMLNEEEKEEAAFLVLLAVALKELGFGRVFALRELLKKAPSRILDIEKLKVILKNLNVELYSLLFEGEENGACQ